MRSLLILLMLSFASMTYAQDSDGERLLQGCNELIGIYKNKKEKRLLASQLVSSSDAMLAGYCMGVVKVMARFSTRGNCGRLNWYQLAEQIASIWKIEEKSVSVSWVFSKACDGW